MKPIELKRKYIELRAEGKSYSAIAEELHISKSTCSSWEKELAEEIGDLKRLQLIELYESYSMSKEARIKQLGRTLEKINDAIEAADFSQIEPAKLLELKIKYMEAYKGEYVGARPAINTENMDAQTILKAHADILNKLENGSISKEQAQRENGIISSLAKSYEAFELQKRLDKLEDIVGLSR